MKKLIHMIVSCIIYNCTDVNKNLIKIYLTKKNALPGYTPDPKIIIEKNIEAEFNHISKIIGTNNKYNIFITNSYTIGDVKYIRISAGFILRLEFTLEGPVYNNKPHGKWSIYHPHYVGKNIFHFLHGKLYGYIPSILFGLYIKISNEYVEYIEYQFNIKILFSYIIKIHMLDNMKSHVLLLKNEFDSNEFDETRFYIDNLDLSQGCRLHVIDTIIMFNNQDNESNN